MPVDVRELLERGAPTPLRDVDVGAVSARGRRLRRRRTATTTAAVAAVVALALLPLPRLLTPSPPVVVGESPDAPLVGTWVSTAADGTSQSMNIRLMEAGRYRVALYYATAPECSGAVATVTGNGQLDDDELVLAAPVLACDDGSTPGAIGGSREEALRGYTLVHDAENGTLDDSFGVAWERPGDGVTADRREPALAYGVDGDIYLADWDGANPVRIADGAVAPRRARCVEGEHRAEYIAFGSAWSPDGRYLTYWDWSGCPRPANDWGTVIVSDPDGDVVAAFPGQGWLISWSPDSTLIAVFDMIWDGEPTIGVYRPDGVRHAALSLGEMMPSGDVSPVWSRDGSSLLVSGVQVPLDGGEKRGIPGFGFHSFQEYSPDGSLVAYMDGGSLVVDEADGPDDQEVGSADEFWSAAWSPSGDQVAFVHDDTELRVRDVTTGNETSLTGMGESQGLFVIEYSPDGDRIMFARVEERDTLVSSLWSINVDGSELRRLVPRIAWADWRPSSPAH